MKTLITASTGNIGQFAVKLLIDRGHEVRATTHDPQKIAQLTDLGADAVLVDLRKPSPDLFDNIDNALLITPVGSDLPFVGGVLNDAAANASLEYVVRISILSSYIDANIALGRWHAEVDRGLKDTGLKHAILRPTGFMQNLLGMAETIRNGAIYSPTGKGKVGFIDAADIALCAVTLLTHNDPLNPVIDLTGPELLSFSQVAALFTEILDHSVKFEEVTPSSVKQQMLDSGLDQVFVDAVIEDMIAVKDGVDSEVKNGVQDITGKVPNSMRAFIEANKAYFQ
ncbi:MAG: NAD(P)H-binding protein [Chloroflexota bacterium]